MITSGIITKSSVISDGVDYFLIDADINHGNSGKPTVTVQGYVIGINEAIAADSDGGNYIGFVTHVDYVMQALDNLHLSYDKISAEQYEHDLEDQPVVPAVTGERRKAGRKTTGSSCDSVGGCGCRCVCACSDLPNLYDPPRQKT